MTKEELGTALILLGFEVAYKQYNYGMYLKDGNLIRVRNHKVNISLGYSAYEYVSTSYVEALRIISIYLEEIKHEDKRV